MRCYLVRHAQTLSNEEHRFQGCTDSPLSLLGLRQAQCLGAYFAGQAVRVIYSSHLDRSIQTAQAIANTTGTVVRTEPGLAELDFGAWEGLTTEEVAARFKQEYSHWLEHPLQVRIPGGEFYDQFRIRVRRTLTDIVARHRNEGVQALVVVSHGGVIASLLADCLRSDYGQLLRHLVLKHASISAVEWRADSPSVLWTNATAHLDSLNERHAHPVR